MPVAAIFSHVGTASICSKMVHRCVVYGCGNVKDKEKQISLHPIPFYNDQNPEAARRRKKWIAFVSKTRNKWTPSQYSEVCSAHFTADDFTHFRRLKRDDMGVCVIPSIHWPEKAEKAMTKRERRMVS